MYSFWRALAWHAGSGQLWLAGLLLNGNDELWFVLHGTHTTAASQLHLALYAARVRPTRVWIWIVWRE